MAKNNYSFEKRQKDIAKKKKQDDKRNKKMNKSSVTGEDTPETQAPGEEGAVLVPEEIKTDEAV